MGAYLGAYSALVMTPSSTGAVFHPVCDSCRGTIRHRKAKKPVGSAQAVTYLNRLPTRWADSSSALSTIASRPPRRSMTA